MSRQSIDTTFPDSHSSQSSLCYGKSTEQRGESSRRQNAPHTHKKSSSRLEGTHGGVGAPVDETPGMGEGLIRNSAAIRVPYS